jgi:streptomycin 3"-adenylyltransferase
MAAAGANVPESERAAWQQVSRLAAGLGDALATDLLGVYVHGSLAMGCFNPTRSDVDVLAVTHRLMRPDERQAVARLLLDVSRQPYPVEISILALEHLHPWRHPAAYDFHYSEGWRAAMADALESGAWRGWKPSLAGDPDLAAHITVTRARGMQLSGPDIADVFPDVPRADYLASLAADVLDERFGLSDTMPSPVYSILNACRTLAYLWTGAILSKAEGGAWALVELPAEHHAVVAAALAAYAAPGGPDDLTQEGVRVFVRYLRPLLARELGHSDHKGDS